jgi:hypothetical protein
MPAVRRTPIRTRRPTVCDSFADDKKSTAKWADLGIDSQTFRELTPDQFEVVDLDPEIELTHECVRNP